MIDEAIRIAHLREMREHWAEQSAAATTHKGRRAARAAHHACGVELLSLTGSLS